jgi:hypothetical protein
MDSATVVHTPWPPDDTGIAEFSNTTLNDLILNNDLIRLPYRDGHLDIKSPGIDLYNLLTNYKNLFILGNSTFHTDQITLTTFANNPYLLFHDTRMMGINYAMGKQREIKTNSRNFKEQYTIPGMGEVDSLGFNSFTKFSDKIAFHSKNSVRNFTADTGAKATYIPFVSTQPDPGFINPTQKVIYKRLLNLDTKKIHIVLPGFIDFATKFENVILTAFNILGIKEYDFEIHFLREPNREMQEFLPLLSNQLRDRIFFHGKQNNYLTWLKAADLSVVVRPNSLFSISGVAVDFGGYGVPIVCSDFLSDDMNLPSINYLIEGFPTVHKIKQGIIKLLQSILEQNILEKNNLEVSKYLETFNVLNYQKSLLQWLTS